MSLFIPTTVDMRIEYPELDNIQEFKPLSDEQLRFVWYYSNTESPFFDIKNKEEKANKCLEAVYGKSVPFSINEIRRYEKGIFPENMPPAMDRMKKFSSSDRQRGKAMIEGIFNNFELILKNADDYVLDIDKQQKYIDNALKIVDALPDLIKKKEEGFGHKLTNKKKDERAPSLMDEVMMSGNDIDFDTDEE